MPKTCTCEFEYACDDWLFLFWNTSHSIHISGQYQQLYFVKEISTTKKGKKSINRLQVYNVNKNIFEIL